MIDTHSHLFAEEFADDLPQVIERAKAAGVRKVFMPNIDDTTIRELLEVCEAYKGFCYPMLGFHPTSVDGDYKARLMPMKKLLTEGHPYIAIGEVGMDLYWDKTYLKEQQAAIVLREMRKRRSNCRTILLSELESTGWSHSRKVRCPKH